MLVVASSVSRLHLELWIEHLDIVPSLTTTAAIWKDANHFVLNMRHILKVSDTKGDLEVIDDLLLDLLWHVVAELLNGTLDFLFYRHFFQFVPAGGEAFVTGAIFFVIGRVLLLLSLLAKINMNKYEIESLELLTLIFSS